MPVVPTYGAPKVALDPLQGGRLSASESALSKGAGVEEARAQKNEALGQFGGLVSRIGTDQASQIWQKERDRADHLAVLGADNQLAATTTALLYDQQNGALKKKGKDAQGLPNTVNEAYDKAADEIQAGLHTDRQREAFEQKRAQRRQNLNLDVQRHVFEEIRSYQGNELQKGIENATDEAVTNALDPRRVKEALDRAVTLIQLNGPDLGLGPEAIEAQVSAVAAKVHVGVIDRLLANDRATTAQVYFDETKGQIKDGGALTHIEKALEEGGLRKAAQAKTDEIISLASTLTAQRELARAIDDPKLRDEVTARLEHEAAQQDRADRERDEQQLKDATTVVERDRSVAGISPATWTSFTLNVRDNLRDYAAKLARGTPVEQNDQVYYDLIRTADDDRAAFASVNLMVYKPNLDRPHFDQLIDLQMRVRAGDTKAADAQLSGFRTADQVIKNTLGLYGINAAQENKAGAQGDAISRLYKLVDDRVDAFEHSTGKKPSSVDVQAFVDDILSTKVGTPGSWWGLFKPLLGWGGIGLPNLRSSEKSLINATIADVSDDDKKQIVESLRNANRPVNDKTILDVYLERQIRLKVGKGGGR